MIALKNLMSRFGHWVKRIFTKKTLQAIAIIAYVAVAVAAWWVSPVITVLLGLYFLYGVCVYIILHQVGKSGAFREAWFSDPFTSTSTKEADYSNDPTYRKIDALWKRATHPNTTEHERNACFVKIQDLSEKHRVKVSFA